MQSLDTQGFVAKSSEGLQGLADEEGLADY